MKRQINLWRCLRSDQILIILKRVHENGVRIVNVNDDIISLVHKPNVKLFRKFVRDFTDDLEALIPGDGGEIEDEEP